jgi:hypothetical protein
MAGYSKLTTDLFDAEGEVKAKPEQEALWFYVQQHAMTLLARRFDDSEPLGAATEFVERYHDSIQLKSLRMFYYLLLICTRESRHIKHNAKRTKLYAKYPTIKPFHATHVQDSSAESAVQAIIKNAPDISLGEYTGFLVDAFVNGSYDGGFGGKAWAAIARPLNDFVHGKITAEILIDTGFTLAHNNGPIFNKGMLYHGQNTARLHKVLDVQRSGQIPQLIAHHYSDMNIVIVAPLRDYVHEFTKLDSGFGGRVDWTQVKNIKGVAIYHNEISAQKASDPKVTWKDKIVKLKEAAAMKAAKLKAQAAKAALLQNAIEILPGTWVPKGKRSIK